MASALAILATTAGTASAASAGAAAGATVVTAAASGAATLSALGSGLLTIGGLGLTGAGALGQMQAGQQQASALNAQSRQSELDARMELLRGREQATVLAKQRDRDLASANAVFATRGIATGEGSAAAALQEAQRVSSQDIQRTQFGAQLSSASKKTTAQSFRSDASAARQAGFSGAVSSIGGSRFAGGLLERL